MSRAKTNRHIILNRTRIRRYRYSKQTIRYQEENEDNELFNESVREIKSNTSILVLLRAWVNCYGISVRAVNALLKILIIAG